MKRKKEPAREEIDNIFEKIGVERTNTMPNEISISELKPHPRNELIYGQEAISDLVDQIRERGRIVVPIIINKENVILSGHRRWGAAKELELESVPCEVREFESSEDELEFLLHSNVTRKKSREQMAREGMVLEEVLSAQSEARRIANLKQFQTERDESSHSEDEDEDNDSSMAEDSIGRTRDEVAKALRIGSGKQFDRMKAVIKKADELKEQGKGEDAKLFLAVLNRSASAAHDLMDVSLDTLTAEDRDMIRTGKSAPRQFLQDQTMDRSKKDKDAKEKSSYVKSKEEINMINRSIKALKESVGLIDSVSRHISIVKSLESVIDDIREISVYRHYRSTYPTFQKEKKHFGLAVESLTEALPGLSFDTRNLEICKNYVEEEMVRLKELLSLIESEMEKRKDNE